MVLHLKKLCVGVDSPQQLAAWRAARDTGAPPSFITRSMPRRRDEILAGGSIYWIFKGWMAARQRIVEIEAVRDRNGRPACALVFDPELFLTRPVPHRPFQGWRYLTAEDAPADIGSLQDLAAAEMPPLQIGRELGELGLL